MQINLFEDKEVLQNQVACLSKLKNRKCSANKKYIRTQSEEVKMQFRYASTLNHASRYNRNEYENEFDSLIGLELSGLCSSLRRFATIIDFSNRLDLILSIMTGCIGASIRKMKNYQQVSEAITALNFSKLEGFEFSDLLGLSDRLDDYFVDLRANVTSNGQMIDEFLKQVQETLYNLKIYCISAVYGTYIVRSMGVNSIILSTEEILDEFRAFYKEEEFDMSILYVEFKDGGAKCYEPTRDCEL